MNEQDKKVPTLRFKGFTNDWEQRKLGTLFQKNIERNDDEKFNYNQTLSVSTMTFKPNGNGASAKSLANYKVLRLGDVAFEGHPNKQFSYGRFVVNDNADGIMSPRFATIRPIKAININYWKNYLHNENIMKYVLVKSTKAGTMMNELVYSDLYKQVLKVPNITEQVKIGNLLQKIEIIITLQQRKLDLLKQLKKGLLQKMFADKDSKQPVLRFKGFHDDWERRKLGEAAEIIGGGTPSTQISNYWNGDINWYTPAEISNFIYTRKSKRKISMEGLENSSARLLPVGTVLFTSRAGIGKTAILSKEGTTNQGFQSIVPNKKLLDSYFIFSLTNELKKYGETHGAGSTFIEISGRELAKAPLKLPALKEQKKIGGLLHQVDELISLQQQKLAKYQSIKKSLLQQMFI
ncbi:restriction endonuclease subunit S [Limosilactobacillus reuteri]|uniref:restriction endonuclease subunit S n=1 Tax=Limosilactobacillus reuteri TaxID=1598 RepID=UPI003D041765